MHKDCSHDLVGSFPHTQRQLVLRFQPANPLPRCKFPGNGVQPFSFKLQRFHFSLKRLPPRGSGFRTYVLPQCDASRNQANRGILPPRNQHHQYRHNTEPATHRDGGSLLQIVSSLSLFLQFQLCTGTVFIQNRCEKRRSPPIALRSWDCRRTFPGCVNTELFAASAA